MNPHARKTTPSSEQRTAKFSCELLAASARQRTDHATLWYAKALRKNRRETTIRKRRLFFAGAVARQNEGRLPSRVMLATMTGGESPRPGGQSKSWYRRLVGDLKGVPSHGGVQGALAVGGRSEERAVNHSKEGEQVVPGGPRSSRTVHGQLARE